MYITQRYSRSHRCCVCYVCAVYDCYSVHVCMYVCVCVLIWLLFRTRWSRRYAWLTQLLFLWWICIIIDCHVCVTEWMLDIWTYGHSYTVYYQGLRRGHVTLMHVYPCIPSKIQMWLLYLVSLAGLAPMLTVDTVTIFRHSLDFARCTVACPLLQSISLVTEILWYTSMSLILV